MADAVNVRLHVSLLVRHHAQLQIRSARVQTNCFAE